MTKEWLGFINVGLAIEQDLLKENPERGTPLKEAMTLENYLEFSCPHCGRHESESIPVPDGDHYCKCGNHQFN